MFVKILSVSHIQFSVSISTLFSLYNKTLFFSPHTFRLIKESAFCFLFAEIKTNLTWFPEGKSTISLTEKNVVFFFSFVPRNKISINPLSIPTPMPQPHFFFFLTKF